MAQPWKIVDSVPTPAGILELRQRGAKDFLITVGGQVLMNSLAHRSEVALGELACAHLRQRRAPRVLVGGLGMAFTLRAVLDQLPESGEVVVAELNPVVLRWCLGPLALLTDGAAADARVTVEIIDVSARIRQSTGTDATFDAIVLDLYTGPDGGSHWRDDPLYGSRAIASARTALRPGGILAVWGERPDAGFAKRLAEGGFAVSTTRPGRGGLRHVVYIARSGPGQPSPHKGGEV
jgi:spermidine synthase